MSTGRLDGGYTRVAINATTGFGASSVEITGLWSGTQLLEGETLTGEDAAGNTVTTGFRQPGQVFTTAVTAAVISTLINTYMHACADIYIRYYYTGGGYIQVGPHKVSGMTFIGATPGTPHLYRVDHNGFMRDAQDRLTIT